MSRPPCGKADSILAFQNQLMVTSFEIPIAPFWEWTQFIGELGYADVAKILRKQERWMNRPEKILEHHLNDYLAMKLGTRPRQNLEAHTNISAERSL